MFNESDDSFLKATEFDKNDPLNEFRAEFLFPKARDGNAQLYFAGHSLGLMPKRAKEFIEEELEAWSRYAVEGHFHAKHPWLPYHENITSSFAKLVGAQEREVVAMNSLTVNLHLMMVSFYRPNTKRFKILIENNTFPSDKYAVDSQARFHGFDPREAVVELKPLPGELTVSEESIVQQIQNLGDSLALVLLGNCNYLSGQAFPVAKIVKAGQAVGARVGFNLAHGAGNLELNLHQDEVDFAVWCSYKYLCAGPGGIAGAFVHARHLQLVQTRFEGWWGNDKASRFKMGPEFKAIPTAEAWQLSNPPIFQLAALRAAMELFDRASMSRLRAKGNLLTDYLEFLLNKKCGESLEIVTPKKGARGSMLCVKVKRDPKELLEFLKAKEVILDFREPDILRICPAPLYNSFSDVYMLSELLSESLQ